MNDERKSHMSSIIGETAVVIGNISGQGDLEIRGKVQGSIEIVGRIHVAEGGIILGNVEAGTVTVSGEVRGDLSASDGIVIQASGEVEGNLLAPRVGVEPGARVRGMLRTGSHAVKENTAASPLSLGTALSTAVASPAAVASTAFASPAAFASVPVPSPPVARPAAANPTAASPTSSSVPTDEPIASLAPEKLGKTRKRRRPRKPGLSDNHLSASESVIPEPSGGGQDQKQPAKTRQKGPPKPPTFLKGAKGHQRA